VSFTLQLDNKQFPAVDDSGKMGNFNIAWQSYVNNRMMMRRGEMCSARKCNENCIIAMGFNGIQMLL